MGTYQNRLGRKVARKQRAQGKISVRLLEFAEPLIEQLRGEVGELGEEQLNHVLMIAATIWNAQVLEQWGRGSSLHRQVRARLDGMPMTPGFEAVVEEMLERKAKLFGGDLRAISNFRVYRGPNGELRVEAEARIATELLDER